jgi:nucleoside-diphosphate-sugar epimerase
MEAVKRLYKDVNPDIVIHLAARVGGIGADRANPGKFFYDDLMMAVQMMEVARQVSTEKFVAVGKAKKEFGFRAKTNLEEGLKKIIEWYIRSKAQ